jgi:[ribosomal protein S5]-alanine N-acetyltransferase
VTTFLDSRPKLDRAAVEARLTAEIACEREHGIQYWPIFRRDLPAAAPEDRFTGCCGLKPRDPDARVFELGFHLRPAHWGLGLATEAAKAAIAFAFAELRASALFAGHHPENEASRRVLERLGFRHTHDDKYLPTGRLHPSYLLDPLDRLDPEH